MTEEMRNRQSLVLLKAFRKIDSPAIRQTIVDLAKAAAGGASVEVKRYRPEESDVVTH